MNCYNPPKDKVYGSIEEILSDVTLTDDERKQIMSKGKTTVQVDATHQRTVWYRTNNDNSNRYRGGGSSSRNTTNGNYNNKS